MKSVKNRGKNNNGEKNPYKLNYTKALKTNERDKKKINNSGEIGDVNKRKH